MHVLSELSGSEWFPHMLYLERGEVSIEGLEDESNVLQYRTYFGQAEGTKRLGDTAELPKRIGVFFGGSFSCSILRIN